MKTDTTLEKIIPDPETGEENVSGVGTKLENGLPILHVQGLKLTFSIGCEPNTFKESASKGTYLNVIDFDISIFIIFNYSCYLFICNSFSDLSCVIMNDNKKNISL